MKRKILVPLLIWLMVIAAYGVDRLGVVPLRWRVPSQIPAVPSRWSLPHVERVDGDTVRLPYGRKIRLVGIDTPEWDETGGSEAKVFFDSWLSAGSVTAEICPQHSVDKYGRLLARLFVDGRDYQAAALQAGRARSLTLSPCGLAYARQYTQAFVKAMQNRRGTWQHSPQIDACDARSYDKRVVTVVGRIRSLRKTRRKLQIRLAGMQDTKLRRTCLRAVVLASNLPLWCPGVWCDSKARTGASVKLFGKITQHKNRMNLVLGHPLEMTIQKPE